jgi:hypothetical protein
MSTDTPLSTETVSAALARLVAVARAEFGETEWRYEKKRISWIRSGRNSREYYHSTPCGPGEEVSKAEYEANIAASNERVILAFQGKWRSSYERYERTIAKPGWRERRMETIKNMESET